MKITRFKLNIVKSEILLYHKIFVCEYEHFQYFFVSINKKKKKKRFESIE